MDLKDTHDIARQTGVRGGSERFSWESLKSIPRNEREHYLGQSMQVGTSTRRNKFYKHNWYIKVPNFILKNGKPKDIHNEREHYRIREQKLMNKLLGVPENLQKEQQLIEQEHNSEEFIYENCPEINEYLQITSKETKRKMSSNELNNRIIRLDKKNYCRKRSLSRSL